MVTTYWKQCYAWNQAYCFKLSFGLVVPRALFENEYFLIREQIHVTFSPHKSVGPPPQKKPQKTVTASAAAGFSHKIIILGEYRLSSWNLKMVANNKMSVSKPFTKLWGQNINYLTCLINNWLFLLYFIQSSLAYVPCNPLLKPKLS